MDAACRRIRVFRARADYPISSGEKSGASVIPLPLDDGGLRSAAKLSSSSRVQAGTIPPSQFLTDEFCSMPGATTVASRGQHPSRD
jgi:hypothetical protein